MALTPQGMAEEMERQLQSLWHARYEHHLPAIGDDQRNILFLAIARGILKYLKDQEDKEPPEHLFSQIELSYGGSSWPYGVEDLELNVRID